MILWDRQFFDKFYICGEEMKNIIDAMKKVLLRAGVSILEQC